MPIYDYRCQECGREVEVIHGIDAAGPTTCKTCGGAMRKALSAPAIHFKGSGWAKKDAQAASHARAAKSTASSNAPGDGSSKAGEDASVDGGADASSKETPGTAAKSSGDKPGSGAAAAAPAKATTGKATD